jgi:hypothetical protein
MVTTTTPSPNSVQSVTSSARPAPMELHPTVSPAGTPSTDTIISAWIPAPLEPTSEPTRPVSPVLVTAQPVAQPPTAKSVPQDSSSNLMLLLRPKSAWTTVTTDSTTPPETANHAQRDAFNAPPPARPAAKSARTDSSWRTEPVSQDAPVETTSPRVSATHAPRTAQSAPPTAPAHPAKLELSWRPLLLRPAASRTAPADITSWATPSALSAMPPAPPAQARPRTAYHATRSTSSQAANASVNARLEPTPQLPQFVLAVTHHAPNAPQTLSVWPANQDTTWMETPVFLSAPQERSPTSRTRPV